ncbi:MAG TPA: DUF4157 domain-containing protein [Kofleriaceae bacterium]|nr:DUF4157 domain-containing protein [Kofleriaceae bacterium]
MSGKGHVLGDARKASASPVVGKRTLVESVVPQPTVARSAGGPAYGPAAVAPAQRKADAGYSDSVDTVRVQHTAVQSGPLPRSNRIQALFDSHAIQRQSAGTEVPPVPENRTLTNEVAPPTGAGSALPGVVQAKMERSFGADFSSVRVHEGRHASALGALAYTQGTDIHFAPGQYQPGSQSGQELIGHELAHVVQQSQGRVAATTQAKGVDVNDDSSLEREADEMGARAARGEPAGNSAGGAPIQVASGAVQRKVIQLATEVPTHYGKFKTTKFDKLTNGVAVVLEFHPDEKLIDAKKIGLSQTAKITHNDDTHTGIDPTKEARRVTSGGGQDYVLDRISNKNNPIYGAPDLAAGDGLDKTAKDNNLTAAPTKVGPVSDGGNATFQLGHCFTEGGALKKKEAALYDRPQGGANMFETAALGLEGRDKDVYFGSVKWGYEKKPAGIEAKDIELTSMGTPTQNLLAPAKLWNNSKTRGTLEVIANPAKAKKTDGVTDVDVPKGTKCIEGDSIGTIGGKPAPLVETLDNTGAPTGKQFFILTIDMKDTGNGGATSDLPIPTVFTNPTAAALYSDPLMKTKVQDLHANSRMEPWGNRMGHESRGVKLVDGPDTGKTGYVDQKLVKQER